MTLSEFVHLYEWKRPKAKGDYAGSLTQGAVDELREWIGTWDDATPA